MADSISTPVQAVKPFRFFECILMVRPLGIRVRSLLEFLSALKMVDVESLHHHFHQASLKHQFDIPDFPNDFAEWASRYLEDAPLAEKFGNLNPYAFGSLELLRAAMVEIVEDHLFQIPFVPAAQPGTEFNFCSDTLLVVDTGLEAGNLQAFHHCLETVDDSSFYYHFYESRFRLGKPERDDFSAWLEEAGYPRLAGFVQGMEIYFMTLKELRQILLQRVEEVLIKGDAP
jgi:hypothetical protein